MNYPGPAGLKSPVLCTATRVILLPCACICVVRLTSPAAPEGKQEEPKGTVLGMDSAGHCFQAHTELYLPEGLWGHCWDQPASSLLIEQGNKVAAHEMLMVLLKIILTHAVMRAEGISVKSGLCTLLLRQRCL